MHTGVVFVLSKRSKSETEKEKLALLSCTMQTQYVVTNRCTWMHKPGGHFSKWRWVNRLHFCLQWV